MITILPKEPNGPSAWRKFKLMVRWGPAIGRRYALRRFYIFRDAHLWVVLTYRAMDGWPEVKEQAEDEFKLRMSRIERLFERVDAASQESLSEDETLELSAVLSVEYDNIIEGK